MTGRGFKAVRLHWTVIFANRLHRICDVARAELGVFAVIVDAKDSDARHFYEHYGFTLLAGEARRLCLPVATALRALEPRKSNW
jgi:hypothetical protein